MRLHRYCPRCGWRRGGIDSWDGKTCKCKIAEPPMPGRITEGETSEQEESAEGAAN